MTKSELEQKIEEIKNTRPKSRMEATQLLFDIIEISNLIHKTNKGEK